MDRSTFDERLHQALNDATWAIQDYMEEYRGEDDYSTRLKLMLSSVISSVIEISESRGDCFSEDIWSELESMAKEGGLAAVAGKIAGNKGYSISDIDPEDMSSGMNYLGQHVSTSLYKHIHDLPMQQRNPEMFLRALETVMANLLNQKFDEYDQHKILDSFCEHIHMALDDTESTAINPVLKLVQPEISKVDCGIRDIVVKINHRALELLDSGGASKLISSLPEFISDLDKIMRYENKNELDEFCNEYKGFHQLMNIIETLASGISSGNIKV